REACPRTRRARLASTRPHFMLPLFERHVVSALELRAAVSYRCEIVRRRVFLQDFGYLLRNVILISRRDIPKLVYDMLK
ncbi:MAG: hypothetical protein WCD63_12645, partial [Terrimicrobiaceae bacterium]